jgi:hypothetical protein
MIKKILIISLLILTGGITHAQQHAIKELFGRWGTRHANGEYGYMQFLTDSTIVYVTPHGFFRASMNYKYKMDNDVLILTYSSEINGFKHGSFHAYIKLLNDSTFLYKIRSSMSADADTNTKKVYVYRKVKIQAPDMVFRFPTFNNLLGKWKGKYEKDGDFTFLDEHHVIHRQNGIDVPLIYKADFTKQPLMIDFYYADGKLLQALVSLENDNKLWIELFPKNNRHTHTVLFNPNTTYTQETNTDVKY